MSEPFDPYRKWLGIPPREQPPHHYRLLGIAVFEDDPDVIDNAAARQMAHLRTFKNSKYAAQSQRLLTEIAAAKVCLLQPAEKAAYDAELRQRLAAAGKLSSSQVVPPPVEEPEAIEEREAPALPRFGSRWREENSYEPVGTTPPPVPIPMPPAMLVPSGTIATGAIPRGAAVAAPKLGIPVASAAPVPVIRRSSSAAALRARRKQSALPMVIVVLCLLAVAVAGGVALMLANRGEFLEWNTAPAAAPPKVTVVVKQPAASNEATATQAAKSTEPKGGTPFPIGTAAEDPSPPQTP